MNIFNYDLVEPDCAILLNGCRFHQAKENVHRNEAAGDEIWEINRKFHLKLADLFDWKIINANQPEAEVTAAIWNILQPIFVEP